MIDVLGYDRTHVLSANEFHHMQTLVTRFQEGGKGWHKEARPALQRLLHPLEDVLDHLGAVNTIKRKYTIRTTVICLLIRAMVRQEQAFWAFSTDTWFELLGTDYYAYVRVHGVTANARQQLIAVAYLLCKRHGSTVSTAAVGVGRSFEGGPVEVAEPIVRSRRDRQFRTVEEKRLIVEATRRAGVSVAAVAQAHGVNANQVFYWRKLYNAGQLESKEPSPGHDMDPARVCLLPVAVEEERPQELVRECKADQRTSSCSSERSIELTLPRGQVCIAGAVDAGTLRMVLRCLLA